MFGFKKKEKKPLLIKVKDVFSIIKSDYDEGIAFCLIDFNLEGNLYTMGAVLIPNSEEKRKTYILFLKKIVIILMKSLQKTLRLTEGNFSMQIRL